MFIATVVINICTGYIGVGYRLKGDDDGLVTSLLVRVVLIISYLGLLASIIYAWVHGLWPSKAYSLIVGASLLSTLWVMLVRLEPEQDDEEEYVRQFLTFPCALEVLRWMVTLALTIVLYNLWWTAYSPLGGD